MGTQDDRLVWMVAGGIGSMILALVLVPLRALTPRNVSNLLVAGRCISSDHESNASLRGAATCFATGHAAGTAAALAALGDGSVRGLGIANLQQTLVQQKVILSTDPNRQPGKAVAV